MSDPNNPFSEGSVPPPPGNSFPPPPAPPGGGFPPPGGGGFPPPPGGGYQNPYGGLPPQGGSTGAIDVGTVFSWAAAKYQQHAATLLGLSAVVAVVTLIGGLLTTELQKATIDDIRLDGDRLVADNFWNGLFGTMLLSVAFGIITAILTIGVYRAALKVTRGESPSFGDLLDSTNTMPYIVTAIVLAILTFIGFVLCILPGVLVAFFTLFATLAALDTGEGIGDAISRSFDIVKANVAACIVLVIIGIAVSIVAALFSGAGGAIVATILQILILPFTALATAAAYRQGNGQQLVS